MLGFTSASLLQHVQSYTSRLHLGILNNPVHCWVRSCFAQSFLSHFVLFCFVLLCFCLFFFTISNFSFLGKRNPSYCLRRRNTRYKNPQLVAQHCFVASFSPCFPFFTLRDQPVPPQKHLLRVEKKVLALSLVFHRNHNLSRSKRGHITSKPSKSNNQRAAFLQPTANVFVAGQVDHARWKTRNIDPKLATKQCCATS